MKRVARKSYPQLAAIVSLGAASLFVPAGAFAAVIASSSPIVVPIGGIASDPYAAVNEYSTTGDPLGTGVGVTSYATGTTLGAYTLEEPVGAVYDNSGNLYVLDGTTKNIYEISTTDTVSKLFSTAFNPYGIAYYAGDFYIAQNTNVYEYNSSGNPVATLATGGTELSGGLAFDSSGNLYASDSSTGDVYKFTGGVVSTFATGLSAPHGIAFDASDHLYATSNGNVIELPSTGGLATGAGNVAIATEAARGVVGVGVDANGTVFVTDEPTGTTHVVQEFTDFTTDTLTTFITYDPEDTTDGDQTGEYFTFAPTPEPASLGLLGIGAVGLLMRRRRKLPNL